MEAHGGRIRAESAGPGRGARFTFTVPLAGEAAGSAGAAYERRVSPHGTGERPRILVVDDDPQMLRYLRDALLAAGYALLVSADHRNVPDLLAAERPALVVLDLVLPGTDGIELMETVPGLADLPVIFISAYGRDETIARALEAGAEDYVVKPFSQTELTARIGAALRRRAEPDPFVLGELALDYAHRRVTLGGRCGAGGATPIRSSCAPTSSGCAASSATTPASRPTSSRSVVSATACRARARCNPPSRTRRRAPPTSRALSSPGRAACPRSAPSRPRAGRSGRPGPARGRW